MGEKQQRLSEAHESYIKSLLMRCKSEVEEVNEESWSVPEMVGFYGEPTLPPATTIAPEGDPFVVKKLVCSPDFPVNDQETIRCQICNKMYASRAAFTGHMKTHAKETEDPYRCNICSKTFAVPARLTRHYRTHTGEKPFRCEYCNKSFSVKENLSVHRRIHTKERPYKCEVCSRAFEHSGKLHRHMRIHTGERPHKCTVCSKTFIQSGQLVIHMRTHTGEKPYVCTVCQKGFTCSKQLKVHSRTHTGEKPYSCEICGKSFGYNHVLKLHQVAHYGEKVYKCTICNETFNSKKSMEAHIKSHSENGPSQPPTPPASSTSESSCTGSDVENFKLESFKLETSPPIALSTQEQPGSYDADIHYVLYRNPRLSPVYATATSPGTSTSGGGIVVNTSGVDLLAGAATAIERDEQYRQDVVFNLMRTNQVLRHPAYFASPASLEYTPNTALTSCDGLRKHVEAVLQVVGGPSVADEEDPLLITPPSSNPVSPAPSLSPPASPQVPDPELCLPPRKRSKRILKSMEANVEAADSSPVRYNSVIHYAKAS